jgi:hypothetical protein
LALVWRLQVVASGVEFRSIAAMIRCIPYHIATIESRGPASLLCARTMAMAG